MEYISNIQLSSAEALTIYLALRRFIRQPSKTPGFFTEAIRQVGAALRHPTLTEQLVQSSLLLNKQRSVDNQSITGCKRFYSYSERVFYTKIPGT